MRLIDADKLNRKKKYSFQTKFGCFPKDEWFIKLDNLFNAPTIDPVHAANACYCKECIYSTQKHIPYDDAYYCKLHRDLMPLNGFCSEGRKDDNT